MEPERPNVVILVGWEPDKAGDALTKVSDLVDMLRTQANDEERQAQQAFREARSTDAVMHTARGLTFTDAAAMVENAVCDGLDLWEQYRSQTQPHDGQPQDGRLPRRHRHDRTPVRLTCLRMRAHVTTPLTDRLGPDATVGDVVRLWSRQALGDVRGIGLYREREIIDALRQAGVITEDDERR